MKKNIANILFGATLAFSIGQSSEGLMADCCQSMTSCMGSGYEYGMNPPVNFADTCSCTWVGHIDYLYWKPYEDCIEWTSESRNSQSGSSRNLTTDNKLINFDWDSGFSLGLGYGFPCDKWVLSVDWTHYRTDTKRNLTSAAILAQDGFGVNFSVPFIESPENLLQFGTDNFISQISYAGKWRLQYNQVDLTLSRRYFAGPCMMLNPYVGVSVLTFKQDMNVCEDINYTDTSPTPDGIEFARLTGRYKCEFKGTGIIAGLNSNWEICSGLGVYGEWGMGAFYGTFDTGQNTLLTGRSFEGDSNAIRLHVDKSFEALRVTNHLALGLSWMSSFNCDRNMFTFKAGWEHNAYFGQNMFPVLHLAGIGEAANLNNATYPKADLYLYGFRFSFAVGF